MQHKSRMTGNRPIPAVVLTTLLLATTLTACTLQTTGTTPANRTPAPDFTLADHTGQEVSLSRLTGAGPVVVVFIRGPW